MSVIQVTSVDWGIGNIVAVTIGGSISGFFPSGGQFGSIKTNDTMTSDPIISLLGIL